MNRRYSGIGTAVITAANIVMLVVVYFWLVLPSPSLPPTPPPNVSPQPSTLPTITPIPILNLVVAIQPIYRGEIITTEMVAYRSWMESAAPLSAITNIETVIGKISRTDILRESPLLTTHLTEKISELSSIGSDVAAILPFGTVAKTLHLSRKDLPLGLTTGDRVSIFYTYQSNGSRDGVTKILAQDALIAWVGDVPANGRLYFSTPTPFYLDATPVLTNTPMSQVNADMNEQPIPIIIAVSPQEAAELIWAEQNNIPLSLVMRPAGETGLQTIQPVDQEYMENR